MDAGGNDQHGTTPGRVPRPLGAALASLDVVGRKAVAIVAHIGDVLFLLVEALRWICRALTRKKVRLGRVAIVSQMVRVGVRSIFIISVVSGSVGLILALQLAPPLDEFGQREAVANIVGVAVLRELGPLIASIVLTGFAGAAIAAEIGTMVVGEEIEALEAHALNPIRFLVVPRVIATVVSMTCLGVISDIIAVASSMLIAVTVLDIPATTFWQNLLDQIKMVDFTTGIIKSAVFGFLIGLIACANGLKVSGGAAGVGRATTATVVECIVSIIIADLLFTAVFYALDLV